ncbi:MAG: hypothetical protein H6706_00300 [Myxococcales bacterium]|nr:hypothetical protein [Myxococcales bacterium]
MRAWWWVVLGLVGCGRAGPQVEGDDAVSDGGPPDAAPASDDGPAVRQGVGSVTLQLDGLHVFRAQPSVEVALFAADGAALGVLASPVEAPPYAPLPGQPRPAEGTWRIQRWWPTEARPARAEVTLRDGAAVVQQTSHLVRPTPLAGETCDPTGFADRCPDGQGCSLLPRPVQGQCFPMTLAAWRVGGPEIVLDLRSEGGNYGVPPPLSAVWEGQISPVPLELDWFTSWRYLGAVASPAREELAVHFGPHRVRVPVRRPAPLEAGDACDAAGVADACPAPTACTRDQICATRTPPTVAQVAHARSGAWEGLYVTGQDPEADVVAVEITWRGATQLFSLAGWNQPFVSRPGWRLSVVDDGAGAYALLWAQISRPGDVEGAEVVVIDAEGLRSAPRTIDAGAVGRAGVLPDGALCVADGVDLFGQCAGACDLPDGDDAYVCVTPGPCPTPERFPAIGPGELTVSPAADGDLTRLPCGPLTFGNEAGFAFTAERAGRHRVVVASALPQLAALALRQRCDLPEIGALACVGGGINGADRLEATVDLAAGETIYGVVESWGEGTRFSVTATPE